MTWPLPPIMCARCRKPVDETELWQCMADGPNTIEVVVHCHGATDRTKIDSQVFVDPLSSILQATAFVPRPALVWLEGTEPPRLPRFPVRAT